MFGKLYALNHVRSDRWYKLGRFVLYGGLEDEAPFPTVRRLVQYEDYALRLMRDAGIATAAPLGIVELTPEREYMLVTEFMDGAEEIGDADIDDQIIDEGLALVRRLWDAGLAHRDIKPANLLVVDGHLVMIDVAFAQVRPSPWRQAVDLANMMLVLAVRTDAPRVYDRALTYFSPDEIAEAFAAARGVASPSQLRSVLKRDGRDLVAEFRLLGPARAPISLQRWGPRRVVLAAAIAAFGVIAAINVVSMVAPADLPMTDTPTCGTNNTMILMAQAVPSAHAIPCVDALPPGWSIGGVSVRAADARFWLDSDRYGSHAVQIGLRSADRCLVERKRRAQPHHPWLATVRVRTVGAQWPTGPHVRVRYSVHHPRVRSRHRRGHDGRSSTAPSSSNLAPTSSPKSTTAPDSRSAGPGRRDARMTPREPDWLDARPPSLNATTGAGSRSPPSSPRQAMTSTRIAPDAGSSRALGVVTGGLVRRCRRSCSAAGNQRRTCVTTRSGLDLNFALIESEPAPMGSGDKRSRTHVHSWQRAAPAVDLDEGVTVTGRRVGPRRSCLSARGCGLASWGCSRW